MARRLVRTALSLVGLVFGAEAAQTPVWRLPDVSVADPAQRAHRLSGLSEPRGLVLVVTAPTKEQEDAQRGWADRLTAARPEGACARWALLEDLDQSWFPGPARRALRNSHQPDRDPLLLIDETGDVRRALGVEKGVTWVLAYDRSGELRFVDRDAPSAASAQRAWEAAALAPAPAEVRGPR